MNIRCFANENEGMKNKKKRNWTRNLFILCMIILPLLNFLVFYLYVNFNSFFMAFQMKTGKGELRWTLDNFRFFFDEFRFENSVLLEAIVNTMITFGVNLFTALVTSFLISYFLYKKIRLSSAFKIILFLPAIISPVVLTRLYSSLIGVRGPVMNFLHNVFGMTIPQGGWLGDDRYAMMAIMLYCIWTGIAGNMILFNGALGRIPEEIIEAAQIDGVSWYKELMSIILPLIWPTMTTLIIMATANMFGASGPVLLLTGGGNKTNTITYQIFIKVYNTKGAVNPQNEAAAWGMIFSIICIPIVFTLRYFLNKHFSEIEY